jgi:hypothetical protein
MTPMSEQERQPVDEHVKRVAELLPFPVETTADMGGTFALQIDLGTRGGRDDPPDTAGIDPDDKNGPHWWVDIQGGERSVISELGLDTPPQRVANWIAATARAEGCPAADPAITRAQSLRTASNAGLSDKPPAATRTPELPLTPPARTPGHER